MKIVVFSYDAEIVIPLFTGYDECHRPRQGTSRRINNYTKTPCPLCILSGPQAGVLVLR
jgi:hypothetical protein